MGLIVAIKCQRLPVGRSTRDIGVTVVACRFDFATELLESLRMLLGGLSILDVHGLPVLHAEGQVDLLLLLRR